MACYITGSNVFGQWLFDDVIINEFRPLTECKNELFSSSGKLKILQITWSYNILEINNEFYIAGAYNGKEHQIVKIPLPSECMDSQEELFVAGNDYIILLASKHNNTLWVLDLKLEKEVRKLKFSIEGPMECAEKRQKICCNLTKVVVINDCYLYLTSYGDVYSGTLPSYVETMHCRGKVCDIQCGYEHFVLLTDAGAVYTWGNGRRLQLGHGEVNNLDVPTEVEALAGIKVIKISAGGWHTLALSEFGDLYAWGWNDVGQLGIKHEKENESYSVPTLVDLFDDKGEEIAVNVKDIGSGSRHSAILLQDNTVWTTGCNKYGQLGVSEEKYPLVSHFKKVFHCNYSSIIMCGAWSTVIESS